MAGGRMIAALLLACLCGSAFGFAVPGAVLNKFTQQATLVKEQNELNPYGLFPIANNVGNLRKGSFLATNWNDANNNPGQGHTIVQVDTDGSSKPFATIDPNNHIIQTECGTQGVGLTMALVVLNNGYVIAGSTPIPVGSQTALPGCLILLDAWGNLLDARAANERTGAGTLTGGGPWAMAVQEHHHGRAAWLFVSYVLGDNPTSTATLTGAHGGMVVRYNLQIDDHYSQDTFWGPAPEVIASGFPTQPGGIAGGTVGPTGLVLGYPIQHTSYYNDLQNSPLFIANNLNSSVDVVYQANTCFNTGCQLQPVAWAGLINGPIGIAQSFQGTIVGANGQIGTLFEIAPTANADNQLAAQLVDNVNDNPQAVVGAGNLFNVMFHPYFPNALFFNDDNFNSFNVLFQPGYSYSNNNNRHQHRKMM